MDDRKIFKLFCLVMSVALILLLMSSCGSAGYKKPVQLRMSPAQIEQDLTTRFAVVDSNIESGFVYLVEWSR